MGSVGAPSTAGEELGVETDELRDYRGREARLRLGDGCGGERPSQRHRANQSGRDDDRHQDDNRPRVVARRLQHHVRDDEEECEELHARHDTEPASAAGPD